MRESAPSAPNEDSVLGRSMQLLDAFHPDDDALSLAELHRRTGMPKPTAYRLLQQLVGWRLLDRHPTGYRLGLRLFELGQLVPRQQGIPDIVSPVLTRLHANTGLTVHLAVLDGTEVVYLHKLESPDGPPMSSRIGGRMPAHCTAVGKALLAHAPSEHTHTVLDQGLRRRSPRTVVTPALFLGQLDTARRHGYARDDEESKIGITCVAAPVFDAGHRVVAAVSITARTHDVRRASSVRAVLLAAAEASQRLSAPSAQHLTSQGRDRAFAG
ncbi:IclR family transcriptional regulator [Amycolatopsis lexingtonensis]|uniref:IclR family transcriptional regulator n=1 Tax=Amycolatopsis lexingtonensis TaxID=218822 RepID=UPI003F724FB7